MTAIRKYRASSKRGFTLVEILIVVIILGILAAIVIPQFTNASTEARNSNVRSQLQTLRSQIELYKLQHKDVPPALVSGSWAPFLQYSDIDGNCQATKDQAAGFIYGPYMNSAPVNPLSGFSTIGAAAADDGGWVYDDATGILSAQKSKTGADGLFDETAN
jgi:general secretion pathway protein G